MLTAESVHFLQNALTTSPAQGKCMADDVLLNKAQSIERAVGRVREEYANAQGNFAQSYTHQDAAILNIQRACEAAIDMGQHLHSSLYRLVKKYQQQYHSGTNSPSGQHHDQHPDHFGNQAARHGGH